MLVGSANPTESPLLGAALGHTRDRGDTIVLGGYEKVRP